jgi:hypothetical protein
MVKRHETTMYGKVQIAPLGTALESTWDGAKRTRAAQPPCRGNRRLAAGNRRPRG